MVFTWNAKCIIPENIHTIPPTSRRVTETRGGGGGGGAKWVHLPGGGGGAGGPKGVNFRGGGAGFTSLFLVSSK